MRRGGREGGGRWRKEEVEVKGGAVQAVAHTNTRTHTHRNTQTHTHTQKYTQTQKYTNTHTRTHKHRHGELT